MEEWLETSLSIKKKIIFDITEKSIITIGRSSDRDIILPFTVISRKHCDIRKYQVPKTNKHIWILFEGYFDESNVRILPKNSTLINGKNFSDFRKATLSDGDYISFLQNSEYPYIIFNNLNERKEDRKPDLDSAPTTGKEF